MRNVIFTFVLLFLPSVLKAMPTVALFLDDNESGVNIRPREAIALSVNETYWWFGKFDLFQAVRQYTMPPHPALRGEPQVEAQWIIPLDAGEFCSPGRAPDIVPRRDRFETLVPELESEHQLGTGLLWTETIAQAGRTIPLSLARSDRNAR
jgi:hypothetical protein